MAAGLMVAARQDAAAGPLPEGWTDTYEGGGWRADLHLDEPLTDLEAQLGVVQTLAYLTRAELLAAISAQDAVRHPQPGDGS